MPGDRLPPQRTYAYERGIAVFRQAESDGELLSRGLVVGEIGRGDFVAGQQPVAKLAEGERHEERVDLEFNSPILEDQASLIAEESRWFPTKRRHGPRATAGHELAVSGGAEKMAAFLAVPGWTPEADGLVFTGSGRQSIATAILALVPRGGRLGVEAITYPMVKHLAARLGVTLVPIGMDTGGIQPAAIEKVHRAASLSALYIQPIVHNPLGISLSKQRRGEIFECRQESWYPDHRGFGLRISRR